MTFSIEWVFGTLFAILVAVIGWQAKRSASLEASVEEIRRDYVRRDDLDGQLNKIDKNVDEVKSDMKEMGRTLAAILLSVGKGR